MNKKMKETKAITLISLIITIIILIILIGVSINLVFNQNGIISKAQLAKNKIEKQTATEIINLKITNIQIDSYSKNERMPTLQELADIFCDDKEIEYVELATKVASLEKINIGDKNSIFTKLKRYPYEFEINKSLQLASIDGVKIENKDESKNALIKVFLDDEEIEELPDKSLGYIVSEITCSNGASAEYDYRTGKVNISDISTTKTECIIKFKSETPYSKLVQNIGNVEELTRLFNTEGFTTDVLKMKECREFLYDNYIIMEPILANSDIAQNEMKKSQQYEVVSKTGQNKTFYNGKAFVLGFSCEEGSYGDYNAGDFLSGNFKWNPSKYYSTTGLSYKVNKFASSVNINGVYGVSINWEKPIYVAFIKI